MGDRLETLHGQRRLVITEQAALEGGWRLRLGECDAIVVEDPSPEYWALLRAEGFLLKPRYVTWGMRTPDSDSEYLARLSKNERRTFKVSQRLAADLGLDISVLTRVGPNDFAEFLALYDRQIEAMRNGIPIAHGIEPDPDTLQHFFMVRAFSGSELVAASMWKLEPERDVVRCGFSATKPELRGTTRALDLHGFGEVRRRGMRWVSLGTDPSLYGLVVAPGLFQYKSKLGFAPIPLHHLDPEDDGADDAEMIVSMGGLTDPALSLAYVGTPDRTASWDAPPPFELVIFAASAAVDVRPFLAPFVSRSSVVLMPPHPVAE